MDPLGLLTWDEFKRGFNSFSETVVNGVANGAVGLWKLGQGLITNPKATTDAIASNVSRSLSDPNLPERLSSDLKQTWNSGPEGKGKITAELALLVGPELGLLGKGGKLERFVPDELGTSARGLSKVDDLANANRALRKVDTASEAGSVGIKGVATPHGPAVQGVSAEAQVALRQVQSGAPVFRQGEFGIQNTLDAQFWSLRNPATTPGYAGQVGMPGSELRKVDWMMGGTVRPNSPVVTRPAPGIGQNVGGSMEAVVPPSGVRIDWFHMPDEVQ